ncbi:hypothetical protein PBPRA0977 [Photobacterium profundum SS9]|uniref:Uncharacterized protein n=1 Tax=Photobacterium profundum (strain SS9) TaxID=298386 RepID=Q6LTI8_PHOPR|nr:hypothetical protein PBPRA0977 [Photobacterium profundum SS9]
MYAALVDNPFRSQAELKESMEAPIGPPATLTCELGQTRKGATAAGDVCAGMWLVGASTHLAFVFFALIPDIEMHLPDISCKLY